MHARSDTADPLTGGDPYGGMGSMFGETDTPYGYMETHMGTGTGPAADPRTDWRDTAPGDGAPRLHSRRDGVLPAVGAALSVRGQTLTCTAGRAEQGPLLHPLVQDFLDTLTSSRRERFTGRCPEAVLLSRHLAAVEAGRGKRAARKPLSAGEARRSLKQAKITARHIREDGDPLHGRYAPPCRSCTALLTHFGVRTVGDAHPEG